MQTSEQQPGNRKSGWLLIGLAFLGFISLGLPDGLDGVAWPSIRAFFSLPLDALGQLLVLFTIGYLASSFSSGRLLARMNVGTLLALSCLATALCQIGYSVVPAWWMMVALSVVAGLGAGAIDAGLNTFAAKQFSVRMVNWLHACYGIGATMGPVIMTAVLAAQPHSPRAWQRGYAIVGIWQLALAVCFGLTRKRWPQSAVAANAAQEASATANVASLSTLRLPVAWLSIGIFFVYAGIETAAGVWVYSLFTESRGISILTAGMWASVYWGGLTAGRLLSGLAVGFVSVRQLLRFCILGVAVGAALIWLNAANLLSFLGLGLMGLALAPIFPSLIAATPTLLGESHTANGVGFQIAASVLGRSLLPGLIGVLAHEFGLEIVGPSLLTAALLLLALHEALLAFSSK